MSFETTNSMASLTLSFNINAIIRKEIPLSFFPNSFTKKPLPKTLSTSSSSSSIKCSAISSLSTTTPDNIIDQEHIQHVDEEIDTSRLPPLNKVWREIHGSNDWEGLLDPMNDHLRKEIIRYGEFSQACYDSFDFDPNSIYCGTCKYQGSDFFERLDMEDRGYKMTRYLYATSNINLPNFFQKASSTLSSEVWSQHANWMGYVAVATDEDEIKRLGRRDILIAWRGTVTYLEWIHDLKDILHPAHFRDDPSIKIESGFFDLYTAKEHSCHFASYSAREQILAEISRLIERYKGEELSITITGHSLGAALALLSAYDLAEMGLNNVQINDTSKTSNTSNDISDNTGNSNGSSKSTITQKIPITVFSFSGPRVGNLKFKERCDELGVKVLRVINIHDKVPKVPGIITNEKFQYQKYLENASFPWSYAHVGVELALDQHHSPYLRPKADLGCSHNLEAQLHLVDGYHGKGKEFKSATNRDIALVNKDCDFLKKEIGVLPKWRQDMNKGMVKNKEGRWVIPQRPRIEAHPEDTAHHFEKVIRFARSGLDFLH